MRRTRTRTALAVVAVASAAMLTACGSTSAGSASGGAGSPKAAASTANGVEKLTAAEILTKAQSAAVAATSVHVAGNAGTVSIDLLIGSKASDAKVGMSGNKVEVVWVGGAYFLKADAATWKTLGNAKASALLAGKYAKITDTMATGYKSFTDMSEFFTGTLKPTGTVSKGDVSTVDGQRVIALKDGSDGSLLFIALDGPPYPVKTSNTGKDGGVVTFSDWNKPDSVTAPAAADVIDLAKL